MPATALISVIDDDDSLRTALVGLMRSLGHAAEGFPSAEAFLDAGAVERSQCIVTDIQMPGLSGIDLKHRLDAEGWALPVIMITARPEPQLHARAEESGAFCLLRKPFEPSDLVGCVDRALAFEGRGPAIAPGSA